MYVCMYVGTKLGHTSSCDTKTRYQVLLSKKRNVMSLSVMWSIGRASFRMKMKSVISKGKRY